MLPIDNEQANNVRNPGRPDNEAGLVRPMRSTDSLFRGWGPKLMTLALILSGVAAAVKPVDAATQVAITAICADHSASLVSAPALEMPENVDVNGEAIVRVDLNETGAVKSLALTKSSGTFELDWAAIRIAQYSRYSQATAGCNGMAESVLYDVTFIQ